VIKVMSYDKHESAESIQKRERYLNAWFRLKVLRLRMLGEIAENPESTPDERQDALMQIALLSGAIETFVDSKGVRQERVSDDDMHTIAMLYRWEAEDGELYLPDDWPNATVRFATFASSAGASDVGRGPRRLRIR
jgi:hypothetical protein